LDYLAAELKAMSFTQVQTKLSDLFGGAAAANAQTFQGRMDRLKVAFDEGVETIGTKLLPIIEALIAIIIEKVVPGFEKFAKLFDPIKKAVDDNKASFQALGSLYCRLPGASIYRCSWWSDLICGKDCCWSDRHCRRSY
jgi:hypothetical protein